jgi:hypothetical protein
LDVDRDGDVDVVAGGAAGGRVWLNDGQGGLVAGTVFSGDALVQLVSGDVDRDGHADLGGALADGAPRVWYGDGEGAFEAGGALGQDAQRTMVFLDADLDGDLDIITGNESGSCRLWMSDEARGFAASQTAWQMNGTLWHMAVADMDVDGDVDTVSALGAGGAVPAINRRQHQTARFPERIILGDMKNPGAITAADLDGDGDLDIVSGPGGYGFDTGVLWFPNTGDGAFGEPVWIAQGRSVSRLYAADFDGDGDLDLLAEADVAQAICWYENPGAAVRALWTLHTIAELSYAQTTEPVDIDHDGDLDVIGAERRYGEPSEIYWFENTGIKDGTLWQAHLVSDQVEARWVIAGDIDGDGYTDVLPMGFASNSASAWIQHPGADGRDGWTVHRFTDGAGSVISVGQPAATADVNGDGHTDLVAIHSYVHPGGYSVNETCWLENDGTPLDGGWTVHPMDHLFGDSYNVLACDLDADGDTDIVGTETVYNIDGNVTSVVWAEQVPAAARGPVAWRYHLLPAFTRYTPLHAADMNRDGSLDLIACSDDYLPPGGAGNVYWFPNSPFHASLTVEPKNVPQTIAPVGGEAAVWSLEVMNAGRAGDADLLLNALEIELADSMRFDWTAAEFAALISAIRVYRDDGNGHFEPGRDALVREYTTVPFDASGLAELVLSMPGDPVSVAPGVTETFHVTVLLGASPVSPQRSQFSVRLRLDAAGTVSLSDGQSPLSVVSPENPVSHVHATESLMQTFALRQLEKASDYAEGFTGSLSAGDLADMNGDGYIDLVVAADNLTYDAGGISTELDLIGWVPYEGEEKVVFTTDKLTVFGLGESADANRVVALAAGDFDCDGDRDVAAAVAGEDNILLFLNSRGAREFQAEAWPFVELEGDFPEPRAIRSGDMDADGDADLIGVSGDDDIGLVWWENQRDGGPNWVRHSLLTGRDVRDACLGDIDRDGDMDIAFVEADTGVAGWLERTAPAGGWVEHVVTQQMPGANAVDVGDLDGDGWTDIVAGSAELGDVVWFRNGGGARAWTSQVTDGHMTELDIVRLLDIDTDGDLDLLVVATGAEPALRITENRLSHRNAVYLDSLQAGVPVQPVSALVSLDVDRDGDVDVAALEQGARGQGQLTWWENRPGDVWQRLPVAAVDEADNLAVADIDLNGIPDLLSLSGETGKASRLEYSGGVWSSEIVVDDAQGAVSPCWIDMDADGDVDLLGCIPETGTVCWWENPRADGPWVRHVVDDSAVDVFAVWAYDAGLDGDMDVIGVTGGLGYLYLWEAGVEARAWVRHQLGEIDGVRAFAVTEVLNREGPTVWVASEQDGTHWVHAWREVIEWYEDPDQGWVYGPHGWRGLRLAEGAAPSVTGLDTVDLDRDAKLEVLAAAEQVTRIRWFDRMGNSWRSNGFQGDDAYPAVCAGDFDGDGDVDIMTASAAGTDLLLWPNQGGHYGVTGWTPAPLVLDQNTDYGAFAVRVTHNGTGPDPALQLVHLLVEFEDGDGNPLTAEQANRLFDSLKICRDDGDGQFNAEADSVLHSVDDIQLTDGRIGFDFVDYDPAVRVGAGQTGTFLVVVHTSDEAGNAEPRSFRVRALVYGNPMRSAFTRAEERELHLPLLLQAGGDPVSGVLLLSGDNGPAVAVQEPFGQDVGPAPGTHFAFGGVTQPHDSDVATVDYELLGPNFLNGTASGTANWTTPQLDYGEGMGDFWAIARDAEGDIGYDWIHLFTVPVAYFETRATYCDEEFYMVSVRVRLSRAVDQPVTIHYDVGGTATGGQVDYQCDAGPLQIGPWLTSGTIRIYFYNDYGVNREAEIEETIVLDLIRADNATIGRPRQHTVFLRDEDEDGDTLSDDWEFLEQGGINVVDGRGDTDLDGMADGWEQERNQDPTRYLLTFPPGWTLFSVGGPVSGFPVGREEMIPGPLWTWEDGRYRPAATLSSFSGFWGLNQGNTPLEVELQPDATRIEPGQLTLTPGWNLVSIAVAPLDNSVATIFGDVLDEIPGGVWEWSDRAYRQATEIHPLRAYWVYLFSKRVRVIDLPPGPQDGRY